MFPRFFSRIDIFALFKQLSLVIFFYTVLPDVMFDIAVTEQPPLVTYCKQ